MPQTRPPPTQRVVANLAMQGAGISHIFCHRNGNMSSYLETHLNFWLAFVIACNWALKIGNFKYPSRGLALFHFNVM